MNNIVNIKNIYRKCIFLNIFLCGVFTIILMSASTAEASQYTPPSLYQYQYYKLDNGLQVLLKRRNGARNVSYRVIVNVGHYDFPCNKRETAHYLEHLLFTGTTKSTEVELDRRIESRGGYWNASTSTSQTIYELDIFSSHQRVALDTLFEIYTDSVISKENVKKSRKIIYRERGGESSALRHWLYARGIGRSALKNAIMIMLPNSGYACPQLTRPKGITREDIIKTYKKYYVPNNTSIVVVGDFDIKKMRSHIKRTFGALKRTGLIKEKKSYPIAKTNRQIATGILAPFLGHDGNIELAFRTKGQYSPDYFNSMVMAKYLNTRLTRTLRYKHGLSYSPSAYGIEWDDYGVFVMSATVKQKDMTLAKSIMESEIKKLKEGKAEKKEIEEAKQNILLRWVQGYEANTSYADYYVSSFNEITRLGAIRKLELSIVNVTPEILKITANRVLQDETMVIIWSTPTLTYTQFYISIVVIVLIIGVLIYLLVKRRRKLHHT